MGLEVVISKLIFNKAIQKKKTNRVCIYVAIFLVFLAAQYFAIHRLGVSLLDYVQEEFAYVVALPILGLIVNMIIRGFQIRKLRKLYGDGGEGFVFDLKKEDIVETNRQNQAVEGKYNADIAVKTRTGIFVGEKYKKTIASSTFPPGINHTESSPAFRAPSISEESESPIMIQEEAGSLIRFRQRSKNAASGLVTPMFSLINRSSIYRSRPVEAILPFALMVAPLEAI